MKTDLYGETIVNSEDVFTALYNGVSLKLDSLNFDDLKEIEKFNQSIDKNADSIDKLKIYQEPAVSKNKYDQANQQNWFMSDEYKNFEIIGYLLDKTTNEEEYQRVVEELELFYQHNMIDVLKYLKYLVDTMRSNSIVWGVGRGSSVASYCLYLLGVHKVNSLNYSLDIREFLK
jgi:DNA polymerase III alpha subunit